MPVLQVDGRQIGDGKPGVMTTHLQALYAAHVKEDIMRGRGAVVAEVEAADLPWALRHPGQI
jgi:branched-chain amino acid aminotransferase